MKRYGMPYKGSKSRIAELGRHSYGFEVSRDFYTKACEQILGEVQDDKA